MARAPSPLNLPSITSDVARDLKEWTYRVREVLEALQRQLTSLEGKVADLEQGGWDSVTQGAVATPSVPTGFHLAAEGSTFRLSWDAANYNGHSHTEVWGGTSNRAGGATRLGTTVGTSYSHAAPAGSYWCFWVKHVNIRNQAGPFNQENGTCLSL